jgi:tetratricopeptide (TPR) repeat protein
MRRWIFLVFLLIGSATCFAQQDEAARADALMKEGKRIEALPLYEHLAKTNPNVMLYSEKLADCYEAMSVQFTDPAEIKKYRTLARDMAKRAVAMGDKTVYIQDMANQNPDDITFMTSQSAGAKFQQEAEKAFTAGDFDTALQKYAAAAEADPKLYNAPLFAGDTAYAQHDLPTAARWFARAISIDPDRETAYRYWGDAILKYGNDPTLAREKFIQAVVAEPYSKYAWLGLKQWADLEKAVVMAPKIDRPEGPVVDPKNPKNVTINIDAKQTDDKTNPGGSAWTMYSIIRASYHGDLFTKEFPNEKVYRHSLKEESTALRAVATTVKSKKLKPEQLDESLRNLVELYDAGVLDCWILISGADNGITMSTARSTANYCKTTWIALWFMPA